MKYDSGYSRGNIWIQTSDFPMIRVDRRCYNYLKNVGKSYQQFMSVSSTPSSAAGACRTEYKRQKTFLKTEKTVAKEGQKDDSKDPLPIVELKPFVKKVWRRENSLPGFYDRFPPSKLSNHVRKHKEVEKKHEPPPSPDPSPDKLEMIIGNVMDSSAGRGSGGSHSPRSRQKLHPQAETIAPKQREHSQSFVPGFITRLERTKTTLMEIQDAEAPTKVYCGLQQSLDRKEMDHPPVIDLKGEKNSRDISRKHYHYNSPISPFRAVYQKNGVLNVSLPPQGHGGTKFYPNKLKRRSSMDRPKTPFYDAFDRKGTLPSIQIGIPTIRKRPNKCDGRYTDSDNLLDNAMPVSVSVHKVGGISNSLHLLSKLGVPTMVERQLSFQLEVDLRRFRRSRDYFPFDMTPTELAKYYPSQGVSMTNGEKEIQKGLELNARRKKVRDKSHKSAPDKLETIDQLSPTPRDSDGAFTRLEGELIPQGGEKMDGEENAQMIDSAQMNSVPNLSHTQDTERSFADAISTDEPNNNSKAGVSSGKTKYRSGTERGSEVRNGEINNKAILPLKINSGTPEGNESSTEDSNVSPGGSSDVIQNVKDANILPDFNGVNAEAILEESEVVEGTSRSSTFITSEHTKFPEVVPS